MRTLSIVVLVGWLGPLAAQGADPVPKPVATWASGPMEVRVAFDRPVDPSVADSLVGGLIAFGEAPKPNDPTAKGRPGGDQGALRIASDRLIDQGRTLVIVTDPHPREATYRLSLPALKAVGQDGPGSRVDLAYDLSGVEVSWMDGARTGWSGWWPLIDPETSKRLLVGSTEHDQLWPMTEKAGSLTFRTLLMLPRGEVALSLDAGAPFETSLGSVSARSVLAGGSNRASIKAESSGEAIELNLTIKTSEADPVRLRSTVGSIRDAVGHPLPRSAFVLPWAPPALAASSPSPAPDWATTGGDPVKGLAVFHGEQAKCGNCHQVRGKGGLVGPDLSSLAGADRSWVYQNIVEPSASIHPDFVSWTVALKDGRIAMGVVRAEGAGSLKVSDIDAKQTVIPRSEVEEIRPSSSSIMPVGLLGGLGEEATRDLLAFLTTPSATKTPAPAR